MRYVNEKSLHSDQTDRLYEDCELTLSGIVHTIWQHPTTLFGALGCFALVYAAITFMAIVFGA